MVVVGLERVKRMRVDGYEEERTSERERERERLCACVREERKYYIW